VLLPAYSFVSCRGVLKVVFVWKRLSCVRWCKVLNSVWAKVCFLKVFALPPCRDRRGLFWLKFRARSRIGICQRTFTCIHVWFGYECRKKQELCIMSCLVNLDTRNRLGGGGHRCRWEDNIKMYLREICCEDVILMCGIPLCLFNMRPN